MSARVVVTGQLSNTIGELGYVWSKNQRKFPFLEVVFMSIIKKKKGIKIHSYLFHIVINVIICRNNIFTVSNWNLVVLMHSTISIRCLTPELWCFFYRVVTQKYLFLCIIPWKMIQTLNPKLMRLVFLFMYLFFYLFLGFASRLKQKSSLL